MPGTIVPLPVMLEEEDQKIYDQLQPPKTMVLRYGYERKIAELPYNGDAKPGCGSKLVALTPRGTEVAEMLTTTCSNSRLSSTASISARAGRTSDVWVTVPSASQLSVFSPHVTVKV